jgi:hypothetical protein
MPLPTGGTDAIRFDMNLGGRIVSAGLDLPLDISLPGFDLDVDGGLGEVKFLGRAGVAPEPGDGLEEPELLQRPMVNH